MKYGRQIHTRNSEHILLQTFCEYTFHLLKMFIRQKTGEPLFRNDYTIGFNSNILTTAFTFFKELIDTGTMISVDESTNDSLYNNIGKKMGAMCCWVSDYAKVKKNRFIGCRVTIGMPPIAKDSVISGIIIKPQLILGVNKYSQNKKEIMKFLNWIYNDPEGIKSWGVNRGPSPTEIGRKVQSEGKMLEKEISDGLALAIENGGMHENMLTNHGELVRMFESMMKKVNNGEIEPRTAADELIHKLQKKLEQLKKGNKKGLLKFLKLIS